MTEHPITPPPELVKQWLTEFYGPQSMPGMAPGEMVLHVATVAARWGADQELEACCEWIYKLMDRGLEWSMDLRIARRPKPLSLKELNLKHLNVMERDGHYLPEIIADLRRAIESLPS